MDGKLKSTGELTFFNSETGEELFKTNGLISEFESFELEYPSGYALNLNNYKNFSLQMDCNMSPELMDYLNPTLDLSNEKLELKDIKLKQIKTHRKKRINKKWAKRYGYKKYIILGWDKGTLECSD